MQDDRSFTIGDGKGAVYSLPDRSLDGVKLFGIRVILAENENELRNDPTQGDTQKHEKLVEE